mgnify:CR=1 FL=1|jgi:hypothetical protein
MALSNYVPEQIDIIRILVEKTANAIRDKKFQRKPCWKKKQKDAYETSADKNYLINPIVLVDVKGSMELCLLTPGKQKDYKFFKEHDDNGNDYLILDGANRLDSLRDMVENNSSFVDLRKHGYKILSCDRKTMHELYVATAGGLPPNRQEVRTGIWGNTSDMVRELSEEHNNWLLKISGLKPDRMKDDAFIAGILTYIATGEFGEDNDIDDFYTLDNFKDKKRLKFILNNVRKFNTELRKGGYKNMYEKTYIMGLIVVFDRIYTNEWVLFNNGSFKRFVPKFDKWWKENLASDELFDYEKKDLNTFRQLLGGLAKGKKQNCLMKNHFNPFINTLILDDIYKNDVSEDLATPDQRTQLILERSDGDYVWVRQNGMVDEKELFGDLPEFIRVPYLEVLNANEYPVDHILPKSKGGQTTLDNMSITTRQYNSLKSDRQPNYTKESIHTILEQYS